jgi:hypothetical protein
MERDRELEELERELGRVEAPYIHRPEELDLRDGMLCWLDGARVCGPDCVAYNPEETDERGEALQGPNKCLPLLYIGQQGAAALATIAVSRKRIAEIQDKERERRQGPPPPTP